MVQTVPSSTRPSRGPEVQLTLSWLLLAACSSEKADTGPADDTDVIPQVHIAPWVGFVAWVPHGSLNSRCALTLDIYDAKTVDTPDVLPDFTFGYDLARGGEWGATEVAPNVNYVVIATASDCSQVSDDTPNRSGTFSLDQDEIQLWWYMDSRAGFSTYTEGMDYRRGMATVTLDEGAPVDEFVTFAEALGAQGTADPKTPDVVDLTFSEEVPVISILAAVTTWDRYDHAEPVWNTEPDWW